MKRIESMMLMLMLASAVQSVAAQNTTLRRPADTISGQNERYYASRWMDACHSFQMDDVYMYWVEHTDAFYSLCKNIRSEYLIVQQQTPLADSNFRPRMYLTQDCTPQRIPIIGLMALVVTDTAEVGFHWYHINRGNDTIYRKELMMLYTHDSASGMAVLVDSVRWDTVTPKPVVMPRCMAAMETDDYDLFMHCKGYDAYFDRPHLIEGTFYVAGTSNSNNKIDWINPMSGEKMGYLCDGLPLLYFVGMERIPWCADCGFESYSAIVDGPFGDSIEVNTGSIGHAMFGPFLPIIDTGSYRLDVAASDSTAGTAYGSGTYRTMTEVEIYAEANDGYRFTAWSDGNSDNPRTVEVYCDTVFEAQFAAAAAIGHAAADPWGVSVTPNPTRAELTVSVRQAGNYSVALLDAEGRTLHDGTIKGGTLRIDMSSMPAGTYFVVVGSGSRSVRKTIVKQ